MGWVNNPDWQMWSARMIEETEQSIAAIDAKDQAALKASGERLVDTCEGCHDAFKPNIPTEGILHVPHHDYGEPLISQ
jgi:cytochrome c556